MADSTHPLAGKTGAIHAWIAFIKMIAVTAAIIVLVTGKYPVDRSFVFNGIHISWAVLVPIVAWAVYWHEGYVGQSRPEGLFYGWMDFIGSAAVFVVSLGAFLSFFPPTAAIMSKFGVPMAQPSELSYVIVFVFVLCSTYDVFWRQWHRAKYDVVTGHVNPRGEGAVNGVLTHNINVVYDHENIKRLVKIVLDERGELSESR